MLSWPWMYQCSKVLALACAMVIIQSCAVVPAPDRVATNAGTRQILLERMSAVVVTGNPDLSNWVNRDFSTSQAPKDADGGSAAPITGDGYFLTADHVLARMAGRNVFLIYGQNGRLAPVKARVVWRSESSDLALLHVPMKTPYFYRWSSPERWLPVGTTIIHGGIATGLKLPEGKLCTNLPPEKLLMGTRCFKMDIPLQPGDSGGPVIDAYGNLVGINSAVEFLVPLETAFFVDSEGNRPNIRKLTAIIQRDRARQKSSS